MGLQGSVVNFFVNLGNYINNYKSSLAGAQRIFEFLDMEKEDNTPHLDDVRRLSGDSDEGIVFDHVYFRYDKEKQILQDVTMKFNKNTFTAIAGMSGGGKTTLLKLLLKFYPPDQGTIRLFGRDITEFGADELLSLIHIFSARYMIGQENSAQLKRNGQHDKDKVSIQIMNILKRFSLIRFTGYCYHTYLFTF